MSSAARLRQFGQGTAAVAAAALVMTAFGPTAFGAWDKAPQDVTSLPPGFAAAQLPQVVGSAGGGTSISAAGLQDDGTIGILDPSPTRDGNQGATLVQPGQYGQRVADIVFTLPNRFTSGDTVDLRLLDRSATEHSDGTANSGPDTLVGFSGIPTVEVLGPRNMGEVVHLDSDDTSAVNTLSGASNAWRSPAISPVTDVRNQQPVLAPQFVASLNQATGRHGHDTLRLRVDGTSSAGDPTAIWTVRLTNVKVDLGANVTPGELRVVPFASSASGGGSGGSYAVPWFMGNHDRGAVDVNGRPINAGSNAREINVYTVPAYVAPVTISSTNSSFVADGQPRPVGTLTLAETKPYVLATGRYRLSVEGAALSHDPSTLRALLTGGDVGESVSDVSVNPAGGYVEFTYTAVSTNPTTPASIAINGLLLASKDASRIRYRLSGGSLDQTWLARAGTSQAVPGGVANSAALVVEPGVDNSATWEVTGSVVTGQKVVVSQAPTLSTLPSGRYTVSETSPGEFTIAHAVPGYLTIAGVENGGVYTDITSKVVGQYRLTGSFNTGGLAHGLTFTVGAGGDVVSAVYTRPLTVEGITSLPSVEYGVTWHSDSAGGTRFIVQSDPGPALGNDNKDAIAVEEGRPYVFTNGHSGFSGAGDRAISDGTTFTFRNLIHGLKFTVAPVTTRVCRGVNQQDIMAPPLVQVESDRLGGGDRYATALKIASQWPTKRANEKIRSAIIASGQNFPDALSASYLSHRTDSPILLTMRDRLPADVIVFLKNHFIEEVYVIGGEAAVSAGVAQQLAELAIWNPRSESDNTPVSADQRLKVTRLGGATRYVTNQVVNYYAAAWGGGGTVGTTVPTAGQPSRPTAIVASGSDWPDALAASVLTVGVRNVPGTTNPADGAYRKMQPGDSDTVKAAQAEARRQAALPLILTEGTRLSPTAEPQLRRLGIQHALVVGGPSVLSQDHVVKKIDALNVTTARLAGENRYGTAAEVSRFAMNDEVGSATNTTPGLGFIAATNTNEAVSYLAQGFPTFADALAVGPKVGAEYNVLSLVQPEALTSWTSAFLHDKAHDLSAVIGVGLLEAVSSAVLNEGSRAVATR